jgi:tetratricopeptide (TPR) repeat protein
MEMQDRVYCEVVLLDFQLNRHQWELDQEEKFCFASHRKDQGNQYFSMGLQHRAIERWEQALEFIHYENAYKDPEIKKRFDSLRLSCHNNIAGTHANLKNHEDVRSHATEALRLDPNNRKALLRRARSLCFLNDPEGALIDVSALQKLDLSYSDKKIVQSIISTTHAISRTSEQNHRQMFGGIFN